jgi:hypothetical protein
VLGFSAPVAANPHFKLDPIYIPNPSALPLVASSLRNTWYPLAVSYPIDIRVHCVLFV